LASSFCEWARARRTIDELKPPQYSPLTSAEQVVVIYAGTHGYLDKLPVRDVGRFERGLLAHLRSSDAGMLGRIREQDQKVAGDFEKEIKAAIEGFAKSFA
jgi:F-type H+-transporting ATPase subunit alpha